MAQIVGDREKQIQAAEADLRGLYGLTINLNGRGCRPYLRLTSIASGESNEFTILVR